MYHAYSPTNFLSRELSTDDITDLFMATSVVKTVEFYLFHRIGDMRIEHAKTDEGLTIVSTTIDFTANMYDVFHSYLISVEVYTCIVWLHSDRQEGVDYGEIQGRLYSIVDKSHVLHDVDQGVDFIQENTTNEMMFIVPSELASVIVPVVHKQEHLISVYVLFGEDKT
ncbi:unnamed protein product [Didymodactylos carnosus]|uniref:Uncharacterized protein n=1 Tax=Didymodactylos carnosus TaxID=1234261 RepID=A0A814KXK3_9BILA|nr:unnamed protein product [Didymodactylos carnosus]CAF1055764.1 unnamed protein product [Didymodactylos carnosus]CAF3798527.1 unnamed protein product [Didymodactylos carnosus]CAF3824795.1 unnamed protein product [Didymodactylos carnosus]